MPAESDTPESLGIGSDSDSYEMKGLENAGSKASNALRAESWVFAGFDKGLADKGAKSPPNALSKDQSIVAPTVAERS